MPKKNLVNNTYNICVINELQYILITFKPQIIGIVPKLVVKMGKIQTR